jgi:hypothetical protein
LEPLRFCLRSVERLNIRTAMRRNAAKKETTAIEPSPHPKRATAYDARVVLDARSDRDDRSRRRAIVYVA